MTCPKTNVETEYKDVSARNAWPALFQHICHESMKFDCTEALKPQNKLLNRYRDVNPYDHSRVVLTRGPCNYINANLVKVKQADRSYILTQGPLPDTVGHFWLMVWEQQTKAVLMLNKLVEKHLVKCHCYWPREIGEQNAIHLETVGLRLEYLKYEDHSYYCTRIFKLTDVESNTSREIIQFHYTTWPDFGVPNSPTAFLEFLHDVRESESLESNVGPAVIHCSAGIGRSGTFCLVDSCLVLIEKYGLNSVDVKEVLLEMRQYRMGLIQTPEQLRFSYQAIIEGVKQQSPDAVQNESRDIKLVYEDDDVISDEDEPPPLPPPRGESLIRFSGPSVDKPLPTIPKSASLNEVGYDNKSNDLINSNENSMNHSPPDRPLPILPDSNGQDSDEEICDSDKSQPEEQNRPTSPSELRQRQRQERKDNLVAKVNDIKRKQQSAEQWASIKRSLLNPVTIGIACILGGSVILFAYLKG